MPPPRSDWQVAVGSGEVEEIRDHGFPDRLGQTESFRGTLVRPSDRLVSPFLPSYGLAFAEQQRSVNLVSDAAFGGSWHKPQRSHLTS